MCVGCPEIFTYKCGLISELSLNWKNLILKMKLIYIIFCLFLIVSLVQCKYDKTFLTKKII